MNKPKQILQPLQGYNHSGEWVEKPGDCKLLSIFKRIKLTWLVCRYFNSAQKLFLNYSRYEAAKYCLLRGKEYQLAGVQRSIALFKTKLDFSKYDFNMQPKRNQDGSAQNLVAINQDLNKSGQGQGG